MNRPPCWPAEGPPPNACARQNYRATVYNETALYGPWEGWRLAGARLIAPTGEWIAPHTLARWLWRESRLYPDS